jgi:formate C-acetyltransferase
MLNGGICAVTGTEVGLSNKRDLAKIRSFYDFYAWYREEFVAALKQCMQACNMLDSSYPVFFPSPMMSATFEGCVKKGEDVGAQGPQYCFSTANACGMANAVDSLVAIKQIVFDEKIISLPKLADAMRSDYNDHNDLLAYVENKCLKYGNDINEVDHYMKELVDLFCSTANEQLNNRGRRYQAGLYTVDDQAVMGKNTGALPDGHRRGVSLSNAVSPVQGMDTEGPTAVMNSALVFNHVQAANGLVLDIKFNPSFFEKKEHRKSFRKLVESYFENGGMEVQFNVVSRETLLAAQRDPSRYRNLIVRVSGFSAYFVLLDTVLQNEIIKRTEYGEL